MRDQIRAGREQARELLTGAQINRDDIEKLPVKREVVVGHCRIGVVHILGDSRSRARLARQGLAGLVSWL